MFGIAKILVLVVLSVFDHTRSLVTLPSGEENDILKAEASARATANSLFSLFLWRDTLETPRTKQYTLVHNYFISLTLQDYDNLKEISKLTRVDKNTIQNVTADFIALLNEILDEENLSTLNRIITTYVKDYNFQDEIQTLQHLKTTYADSNKYANIKSDVLKILDDKKQRLLNISENNVNKTKRKEKNLLEEAYTWNPKNQTLYDARRIYSGDITKIKNYPFMGTVEIFNEFMCGASIIARDLLITAASCLQLAWNNRFYHENPMFLSVRVGSNYYLGGGEVIPVLEIYFHPSYVPRTLQNNLAVMRLVRHLNLKKTKVKKIDIDQNAHTLPVNTGRILVLGWGAYTSSNIIQGPFDTKLRITSLPVYDLKECQEHYSKEYVTKKNFCAGLITNGRGACNRDAGGPGIVDAVLTGVISFGSPICGAPDSPTVFTKLGYYYDWIEEIMEQEVSTHKKKTTEKPEPYYNHFVYKLRPTNFYVTPITTRIQGDIIRPTVEDIHARYISKTTKITNTSSTILPLKTQIRDKVLDGTTVIKQKQEQKFKQFLNTIFHNEEEAQKYLDILKKSLEETDLDTDSNNEPVSVTEIIDVDTKKEQKKKIPVNKDSESGSDDGSRNKPLKSIRQSEELNVDIDSGESQTSSERIKDNHKNSKSSTELDSDTIVKKQSDSEREPEVSSDSSESKTSSEMIRGKHKNVKPPKSSTELESEMIVKKPVTFGPYQDDEEVDSMQVTPLVGRHEFPSNNEISKPVNQSDGINQFNIEKHQQVAKQIDNTNKLPEQQKFNKNSYQKKIGVQNNYLLNLGRQTNAENLTTSVTQTVKQEVELYGKTIKALPNSVVKGLPPESFDLLSITTKNSYASLPIEVSASNSSSTVDNNIVEEIQKMVIRINKLAPSEYKTKLSRQLKNIVVMSNQLHSNSSKLESHLNTEGKQTFDRIYQQKEIQLKNNFTTTLPHVEVTYKLPVPSNSDFLSHQNIDENNIVRRLRELLTVTNISETNINQNIKDQNKQSRKADNEPMIQQKSDPILDLINREENLAPRIYSSLRQEFDLVDDNNEQYMSSYYNVVKVTDNELPTTQSDRNKEITETETKRLPAMIIETPYLMPNLPKTHLDQQENDKKNLDQEVPLKLKAKEIRSNHYKPLIQELHFKIKKNKAIRIESFSSARKKVRTAKV